MKNRLYALIIFLAVLCMPEFVSAQARRINNNAAKPPAQAQKTNSSTQAQKTSTSTSAQAQLRRSDTPNYTLASDNSFAHWSINAGVGVSIFDGDITESAKRVIPDAAFDFTLIGNIERTFNPIFGLGLGYAYIPYAAEPEGQNTKLKGTAQEVDLYLSVNMLNLFYRSRPQAWGLFINIGMGMSFYNAKMTDKTTGDVVPGSNGYPMDLKDGIAWVWPLSAQLEYNLSKYFAMGLKAEYRLHDKDNFEGYTTNVRKGNWNDAFELLSLTFRYKPHFGKAYHVRNLSYGDPSMRDINRRLAEMENMIKNMAPGGGDSSCCANNANKIEQLEKQLRQKADTGFVIEKLQNAAVGNVAPVNPRGVVDDRMKKVFNEALRGIQFETAKADIKPVSYPILDNVVTIMKENPGFDLDIIGHTDNVGNAAGNLDLSDRRAHAVRTYLMNKGISGTRLTSSGRGLTEPIATNNTVEGRALNRRVEFVVKQDGEILFKSESE